jgi:hypothetical protein
VIDLLRDKLHVLSAQLADARERIGELEARQIEEGGALERSSLRLVGVGESAFLWCSIFVLSCCFLHSLVRPEEHLLSGDKVADLSDRLAARERESIDVLVAAENVEVKLSAAHERLDP